MSEVNRNSNHKRNIRLRVKRGFTYEDVFLVAQVRGTIIEDNNEKLMEWKVCLDDKEMFDELFFILKKVDDFNHKYFSFVNGKNDFSK